VEHRLKSVRPRRSPDVIRRVALFLFDQDGVRTFLPSAASIEVACTASMEPGPAITRPVRQFQYSAQIGTDGRAVRAGQLKPALNHGITYPRGSLRGREFAIL
jgi:hypothetical protein